jgi:hypothetical protein
VSRLISGSVFADFQADGNVRIGLTAWTKIPGDGLLRGFNNDVIIEGADVSDLITCLVEYQRHKVKQANEAVGSMYEEQTELRNRIAALQLELERVRTASIDPTPGG